MFVGGKNIGGLPILFTLISNSVFFSSLAFSYSCKEEPTNFSISLTILMTISCANNNTNANLSVEKQYITIDEFNNQLKLDEEKYQALLSYTNVLEEKIISLEKHQGELIFKIKRFQDDLQGVCDYTDDEGIQLFSCNYIDQF